MSRSLRFERLVVRRLPGFPSGGPMLESPGPGVNLVLGPNESGKSTAARALHGVLWPELLRDHYGGGAIDVEATLRWQGSRWTVHLDGARTRWQKDGVEHPTGPTLPPRERAGRYLLSLQDLVGADDAPLAAEIRRLSAGGVDFDAAHEALGLRAGGVPTNARSAWRSALDDLRSAEAAARELQAEADRLPALEAELARARTEAAHLPLLERIEALDGARTTLAELETELDAFPDGMARLRPGDDERWRELTHDATAHAEAVRKAESAARAAREARANAGLADDPPAPGVLAAVERIRDEVRDAARDLETARGEEAAAAGARDAAREGLGLGAGVDPAVALTPDILDRVDGLVEEGGRIREARAVSSARLDHLRKEIAAASVTVDEIESRIVSLSEEQGLLREWQGAMGAAPSRPDGVAWALRIAGGVLALVGIGLLFLRGLRGGGADSLVIVTALLVMAVGVALGVLSWRRTPDPEAGTRARARSRGLDHDDWSPEGVRGRLTQVERELGALHALRRTLDEIRRIEEEELPQVERREDAWEADVAALADEVGLTGGDLTPSTLARLAPLMVAWDGAHRRHGEAQARRTATERRLEELLGEGARALVPWAEPPATPAALHGALTELTARVRAHHDATATLQRAKADTDDARSRLEEVEARRTEMARRLDLSVEEVAAFLEERMPRLPAWREASDRARVARATVERLDAEVGADPEVEGVMRSLVDPESGRVDRAALQSRRGEMEEAAARVAQLQEAIGATRRAVADGRTRHDVEHHMARRDAALDDLEAWRDAEREKAVARALLQRVRSETEDRSRPKVFERARSLMATITRGRYTIALADPSVGGFRAVSRETGVGLAPHELSSGTRVQLLLAVRLAFVEVQEGEGAVLPLLLDEVLGTSDDHRARAIVHAATALAASGRQLFYFTAQADEIRKWREATPEDSGEGVLHTLGSPGGSSSEPQAPALVWETPEDLLGPLPRPDGRDHEAYGALLGVAPLRLWAARPVESLHPWHLGDDPEALHELLRNGLTTWGRVETFVTHAGSGVSEALSGVHTRMKPQAELCEDFVELARRGRGRPVDRGVLESTDAVSDVWIDRVAELCVDLDGDARKLLEALETKDDERAKGFRSDKLEQLRDDLVEGGHLSLDDPYAPEELLARLHARAQRLGAPPSLEFLERRIRRWLHGPQV